MKIHDHVSWSDKFQLDLLKRLLPKIRALEDSVSVIIQGPIKDRSVKTIPNYLKYGEVVFSCWDKDDISRLDEYKGKIKIVVNEYSKVPKSKNQPGAQAPWIFQHFTTLNGLKSASGNLCIKVRSDESYPILDPLVDFLRHNRDVDSFRHKIITSNIYFRYQRENLFHPSDHIICGNKRRMIDVFEKAVSLCIKKSLPQFPEQLFCQAVMESYFDPVKSRFDKMESQKAEELMNKHFDIIRIRDLPNHIWTSSYRKYDALYNEEGWCHRIDKINS